MQLRYHTGLTSGTQVARWYCPESHTTFSLLPDCLAARLPGTLKMLEEVVAHAEQTPSVMKAADQIRRDAVQLPGAMRWVRRRVRLVQHVLRLVIGLLPRRAHRLPQAARHRCGVGVAALADRAVAGGTGSAARASVRSAPSPAPRTPSPS